MLKYMNREEFRRYVFERDNHTCVVPGCGKPATDPHHIMERKLWLADDPYPEGYLLENGASLCETHHIQAERSIIMPQSLRQWCGISAVVLPQQLEQGKVYDKWGKESPYVKYPKTFHLPWSPGTQSEDRILPSIEHFVGKEVVVTEKLDGENTSMYSDHIHARSLDSIHHPSRTAVKQLHGNICYEIPAGWRVCGENVYAKHSIHYTGLTAYFYVFGIYNNDNICLSWDDTKEVVALLDLECVPVLYRGVWDEEKIKACWTGESVFGGPQEGYVVRCVNQFPYTEFSRNVAKFVRKGHVQTSEFWMNQPVVKNILKTGT